MLVDGPDGLGKVSEHFGTAQVEVGVKVMDNPRKNWILREVVQGSVGELVDIVQVLIVRDLAINPKLGEVI